MRYALSFQDHPKAVAFAQAMGRRDPVWLKEIEEYFVPENRKK